MLEGAPPVVAKIRDLVAKNKSFSGAELTPEERTAYVSDIQLVDRYLAEVPRTEIVLPTITVKDELLLYRGTRTIDIRYLGRGHTSGDLVVHLPKENIVASGDLVVWPVPLIGSDQSHVADWSTTLDKLVALRPAMIVPGHGPVLRDDSYPRTISAMLKSIDDQAHAAVARGETLEQARKNLKLDDFRPRIAGDDKIRNLLFSNYVAYPAIEAAYKEASANAQANGVSSGAANRRKP
jgi:cyclase